MSSEVVSVLGFHKTVRSRVAKAFPISFVSVVSILLVFSSAFFVSTIAQAKEFSASGRASATVMEPVSAIATREWTVSSEACAKPTPSESCTGQITLRGAGAFAFSLNVLRLSTEFADEQQIKVEGSNTLAGGDWLDRNGSSIISVSGDPFLQGRSHYESMKNKVLIQVSYN